MRKLLTRGLAIIVEASLFVLADLIMKMTKPEGQLTLVNIFRLLKRTEMY